MSYLSKSTVKGHDYYRIMESYREDGRIKHRTILNIGNTRNLFELLQNALTAKESENAPPGSLLDAVQPDIQIDPVRCRIHGPVELIRSVAEWLMIPQLMDSIFPSGTAHGVKRSTTLLVSWMHRACDPGSMSSLAGWLKGTSLPDNMHLDVEAFTAQDIWEQMDEITIDQIKDFELEVFKRILSQCPEIKKITCLSSDFTNYYTYISNQKCRCTIAQLGHSNEGRTGQNIFCVAVILSPLLGIPIATMVYEGNYNDKTALKLFYAEIKDRLAGIVDFDNITFVFDGGGASEETLACMPGHFITRGSIKSSPELYDVPLSAYETIKLGDNREVKAHRDKASQYGQTRTVVITLSDELKAVQVADLEKKVRAFEENVAELNTRLKNPRALMDKRLNSVKDKVASMLLAPYHMEQFLEVTYETVEDHDPVLSRKYKKHLEQKRKERKQKKVAGQDIPLEAEDAIATIEGSVIQSMEDIPKVQIVTKILVKVNEERRKQVIDKYYGKHLLTTDHDDWDTQKILVVYRDQEYMERFFRDSKNTNYFSVRPSFHWTDQQIRVHVMLCYLGLSICRFATYLMDREQNYHVSCDKLLNLLEGVQECLVPMSVNGERLESRKVLSELDGEQKEAWQAVCALKEYMNEHPTCIE